MAEEQKAKEAGSCFRIHYYKFAGRGEPIKLAASLGDIAFESHIISIPQHMEDKAAGKRIWSGPPEITLFDKDGKDVTTIGQSNSCLRYVGKLASMEVDGIKLYPANALQRARIDGILDSMEDVLNPYVSEYAFARDEEARAAGAKKLVELYEYWFGKFELRLEENERRGGGLYFVGDALTIADLKSYSSIATVCAAVPGVADLFKKYERLNKWFAMLDADEKIKTAKAAYEANYKAFEEDSGNNIFKHNGKHSYPIFQSKYN